MDNSSSKKKIAVTSQNGTIMPAIIISVRFVNLQTFCSFLCFRDE